MKVIGLTGGIACGKSQVSKLLGELGIPVVDCDLIARQVVEPGTNGFNKIVQTFGQEYVNEDGSGLDRLKLGNLVFKDKEKLKQLTAITGPEIFKAIMWQLFVQFMWGTPMVVVDAPTLYETKSLLYIVSNVIVVACTEEIQIERMKKRDNYTTEQAMDRIKAQMPVAEKMKLAQHVIVNEGTLEELTERTTKLTNEIYSNCVYSPSILASFPGIVGVYLFFRFLF